MVAEAALLTPFGWLASPIIKLLLDKAHHHLGTGIDKKMKILEATVLPRLSLAIEKAEKSPNKGRLVDWLERLKGAYYEAEEAIDLFEYELLKQKVKDNRKTLEQKEKNERGTRISFPSQFFPQRLKICSVKLKYGLSIFTRQKIMLKGSIDKLIEIAKEANEFRDLLEDQQNASGSDSLRDTASEPPIRVFGREKDKEIIVGLLTRKNSNFEPGPSTSQAIPIIAITGRSGVGKTVLAQYIYKYMEEQKHFDLLLWVHVPRKFKATDVIQSMIKNVEAKEHTPIYNPSEILQPLLSRIKCMLETKKLLLVLDDFWSDTEDIVAQWENFIGCLSTCLPESRIIVTTQSKNATQQAGLARVSEVDTYNLEEIEEGQFLELFMHYAWPSNTHLQKEEFEKIGRKIAVKLKGDPGAAKLVGHQLSEKLDLRLWEEVAQKDWLGDNMKGRIWSYQQLSPDLQRCFGICSLFPKSCTINGDILIGYWVAEGFIRPTDNEERLENIGGKYLEELVSRFFLEQSADEEGWYQLHDLFHDLAERVQGDDFIRIDSTNSGEIPSQTSSMLCRSENIRHISLPSSMINQLKEKLCLMKNIRTFWVHPDGCLIPKKVLEEILKHMKKLRELKLVECCDELPKSIGNLKHLRRLNFVPGPALLKKLPDSVCKLYHLKMLLLPNCESVPKNMSELINLCSLTTLGETMSHISHVGRMTSLQVLDQFVVRKKRGYELHQLENLNQLRGLLCIKGLENVGSISDAVKANMQKKKHLDAVKFEWKSDERETDNVIGLSTQHVQLLDALQPHPNISALTLKQYGGDRFPNWLLNQNSLRYLKSLTLMKCDKVEEISSIDKSVPNCESLILRGLKNLKKMPSLPQNLTYLDIGDIGWLSFFSEADLLMKEERKQSILEVVKQMAKSLKLDPVLLPPNFRWMGKIILQQLGNLSEDHLFDAWGLVMHWLIDKMFNENEVPKLVLPSSLTKLKISTCWITSDALSTIIQCPVSLSELELSDILTITSLPSKEVLCSLKNLQCLTIKGCFLLNSLGGIGAMTFLTVLEINGCLKLNSSNEPLPSSLESLKFSYCSNVDVILAESNLPILRFLELIYCKNQRVLHVGHLSYLKHLYIMGWDGGLEGLNSLTGLSTLCVMGCPETNLSSPVIKYAYPLQIVTVDNLLHLKLILSNETISTLPGLVLVFFQGESEVLQAMTSLKFLIFMECNITHLPKNLKNIASLELIILKSCPLLSELEDLPMNIQQLQIIDCPTLTEKFKKGQLLRRFSKKKKFKKGSPNYQVRFDEFEESTIVTFPNLRRESFLSWNRLLKLQP